MLLEALETRYDHWFDCSRTETDLVEHSDYAPETVDAAAAAEAEAEQDEVSSLKIFSMSMMTMPDGRRRRFDDGVIAATEPGPAGPPTLAAAFEPAPPLPPPRPLLPAAAAAA